MMYSGYGYGTGIVFSVLAITAGAIMYWAITAPATGFRISTVGVVLMLVGAGGILISLALFGASRVHDRGPRRSTYDRQAIDSQGRESLVHEEVR
jgi:hypothetical protein